MSKANFRKISTFVILLFVLFPLAAQQDEDFFFGRLIDASTGEPVVFATIRVEGKALGVISNSDGGFKIPSDFQLIADALEISSMGYETKRVGFATLRKNTYNSIFLKPFAFELQEAVVTAKKRRKRASQDKAKVIKPLSAKQIIRYAIERIPFNYNRNPFELVGYYRDYQTREQEYLNLNEALVKVFDRGFEIADYNSLQYGLYNYRSNREFPVDSFAAKPYDYRTRDKYIPNAAFNNAIVPNELVLLFNHDAIRHHNVLLYSYVDVFVEDFIREHDFLTYYLTNYGDKKVFKIKFVKELDRFEVKGDIYIDENTFAIRKLDYAVYRKKTDKNSNIVFQESESDVAYYDESFAMARASNSEVDLLYEILVEYREHSDCMYLNYISFHNRFKLVRPPDFYLKNLIVNYDTRQVHLVLNKPAKNWYDLKSTDLKIYYGENRLKVDGLSQVGPSTYSFEFARNTKSQRKRLRQFFTESEMNTEGRLNVEIQNMIDFDGHVLGEENSELLNQFREFFTQKVIDGGANGIRNAQWVDKAVPLGHKEQPQIKAQMDEEFWMNTPLKTNPQE